MLKYTMLIMMLTCTAPMALTASEQDLKQKANSTNIQKGYFLRGPHPEYELTTEPRSRYKTSERIPLTWEKVKIYVKRFKENPFAIPLKPSKLQKIALDHIKENGLLSELTMEYVAWEKGLSRKTQEKFINFYVEIFTKDPATIPDQPSLPQQLALNRMNYGSIKKVNTKHQLQLTASTTTSQDSLEREIQFYVDNWKRFTNEYQYDTTGYPCLSKILAIDRLKQQGYRVAIRENALVIKGPMQDIVEKDYGPFGLGVLKQLYNAFQNTLKDFNTTLKIQYNPSSNLFEITNSTNISEQIFILELNKMNNFYWQPHITKNRSVDGNLQVFFISKFIHG